MDKLHKQYLIYGKVQGVGFRNFVKAKVDMINAESIKIVGSVENLDDGSVRVVASGSAKDLEILYKYLALGTIKSKVERIESSDIAPDSTLNAFSRK